MSETPSWGTPDPMVPVWGSPEPAPPAWGTPQNVPEPDPPVAVPLPKRRVVRERQRPPTPSPRWSALRRATERLVLAVLAVLACAGVVLEIRGDPVPDPPAPSGVAAADPARPESLLAVMARGSCFDGSPLGGTISPVGCDVPHDEQYVGAFRLPSGTYPGDVLVAEQTVRRCMEVFTSFTGTPFLDQHTLRLDWSVVDEDAWGKGVREVRCAIAGADGAELTRSLEV